jgi:AAA ATPase domain
MQCDESGLPLAAASSQSRDGAQVASPPAWGRQMLKDAGVLDPRSREGSLVGREQELTVFEQALARLAHGSSQVIEVTGDPGIGKTRLLAELGRLAAGCGLPVLYGQAQHGGSGSPSTLWSTRSTTMSPGSATAATSTCWARSSRR